jgi:predicted TIM-barrel fold metal-dependent hydrolase
MRSKPIISSDSHVVEPPNLWLDRMDPKHGDRIPHLVEGDDYDRWYCNNVGVGVLGGISLAGLRYSRPQDITLEGRFADVPPGGYDPHAHVKDMDVDGVYAGVLYPSIGLNMYSIPDSHFMREVFSAYNDWLADFCNTYPNRLKGIAMILLDDDIEAGISELKRTAGIGLCGAMIPVYPRADETYDSLIYEPFWAAAHDLEIPLSLHTGTNRPGSTTMRSEGKISQTGVDRSNTDHWVRMSMGHIIFSGVLERFPNLKIVNVEHDLAWIPYYMHRMDLTYIERPTQAAYRFKNDMLPSDFMRRNIYHSFQDDGLGIRDRGLIGLDKLIWASDYPHAESTFPESQRVLSEILDGVPDNEREMIVSTNCAKLYSLD